MKGLIKAGLCGFLVFWLWGMETVFADSFDPLSSRFSGITQNLHASSYGNGAFVAVGNDGTILRSQDSVTWTPEVSGTTNPLHGVIYGTNGFVAVGLASAILKSPDGITWTQCTSPVTNDLSAVCYGDGRYVAVGSSGIIVTSTNGVNWSSLNTGAPYNFNAVAFASFIQPYANSIFVLVGDSGAIMTSADGLGWTSRSSGTFFRLNAVSATSQYDSSHNSSSFHLLAAGDSGTLETSSDGITWTVVTSGTTSNLLAVANDADIGVPARFGVVGQGGVFLTGTSNSFLVQTEGNATNLNGIVYAHGNFLAVGDAGSIQAAIPWQPRNTDPTRSLLAVAYGDGTFIAVGGIPGNLSTNIICRSTNGSDWKTVRTGTEGVLRSITFGTNGFVASGQNGVILTSTNGLDWISQYVGTSIGTYFCGAFGNGYYVVLGVSGTPEPGTPVAYRSADGLNWAGPYQINEDANIATAFANNTFVSVGGGGLIATSPDGITWTPRSSGFTGQVNGIAYGNGAFVAVGNGGAVSSDGTNWTTIQNSIIDGINGGTVAYGDQGFVVPFVATYGVLTITMLQTSSDGTNWTIRGFDGPTSGFAFGNGSYVAVGTGISQTIPVNSQATPLLAGKFIGQGFKLSATAQPGFHYRVQRCTDLALTNWSDIYTFSSTQSVTTYTDSVPVTQPQGFYRIASP